MKFLLMQHPLDKENILNFLLRFLSYNLNYQKPSCISTQQCHNSSFIAIKFFSFELCYQISYTVVVVGTMHTVECGGKGRRISTVGVALLASTLFFWVILILSQDSLLLVNVHRQLHTSYSSQSTFITRKGRFLDTTSFYIPSSSPADDGQNKVYEEDKRLVHTGPNPLHN